MVPVDPLRQIADRVRDDGGIDVWFPATLEPHAERLMASLGVRVHIDPWRTPEGRLRSEPMVECRAEGCATMVDGGRGLAAYCVDHRRAIAAKRRPAASETPAARSLSELARRRLVPAAQQLERRATAHRASKDELRAAVTTFNEALRELNDTAKQLLGDGAREPGP